MITLRSALQRTSQQKERGSFYPRQADKFVKNDNLVFALDSILTARTVDPGNPYAHAYEERVMFLIRLQRARAGEAGNWDTVEAVEARTLDLLSDGSRDPAIQEIVRALYANPNDADLQAVKNNLLTRITTGRAADSIAA